MSDLSATIFIRPATPITVSDYPHPDISDRRVTLIHADDLTIHFGSRAGGDAEIAATTGRLIEALSELRDAANERIADRTPVAVAS